MIQQKLKLGAELNILLKNCEEIWIAVAMISDRGFKYIQDNICKTAKQNYLVGIGLPTSPVVLRQLMINNNKGLMNSRIHYKQNELFHPKVYIVKSKEKLTAFVGSGNCTEGGFTKNIELSIKTNEQDFCNHLLIWFNTLFKHSMQITEDFLQSYQILYENRKVRIKNDQQEIKNIFPKENLILNIDEIDFSNQFFKKEHFQAFEGNKPLSCSDKANEERIKVKNKLYKLNDKVLPIIEERNWSLTEHYVFDDIVSSAIHGIHTSKELNAIWLHYGRNKREIKAYGKDHTPLDFMRLQVIIHKNNVGVWNRIGKDNGSLFDRSYLKNKLSNDIIFRDNLFNVIQNLPDEFYIILNDKRNYVREFSTEQMLTSHLLKDNYKYYLIIGIEFTPDSDQLSNQNITNTVINNFELLYPTYQLIKHTM